MVNMVSFVCDYCGLVGQKYQRQINKNKRNNQRLFCNITCASKASRPAIILRKKKYILLNCHGCLKYFLRRMEAFNKAKTRKRKSKLDRVYYCTAQCENIFRQKRSKDRKDLVRKTLVLLKCSECDNFFLRSKWEDSYRLRSAKTCSMSCNNKFMNRSFKTITETSEYKLARFWEKVDKTPGFGPSGDCWKWVGAKDIKGYGAFYCDIQGSNRRSHRISYYLTFGFLPENLYIRHKCDNPPCVNPNHLIPGTAKENTQDMVARGRNIRGENHPHSKLNNNLVREIRNKHENENVSLRSLSKLYNVGESCIKNVIKYRSWKGVT